MHSCIRASLIALCLTLTACDSLPDWMKGDQDKKPKLAGERIAVLKPESSVKVDASLSDRPLQLPAPESRNDWPAHHGDVSAFIGHPTLGEQPTVHASMTSGNGADFSYLQSIKPILAEGVLFTMDAVGEIAAYRVTEGYAKLWDHPGVKNEDGDAMLGGGIAYSDGKLFAVSGNGLLAAFDPASGKQLWRQSVNIPVRAAPTAADGRVSVVTIDSQMFAFDAATGNSVWVDRGVSEGASFIANASVSYSNGLLAIPYASSELRIVSADDGRMIWSDVLAMTRRNIATSSFSGMGGDPVIIGNALYAVSASGILAAYRLDNGLRVWEQPISSVNTPWVAGNVVFVLSTNDEVIALNRIDGRVYWVTQLDRFEDEDTQDTPYTWHGPVLAGNALYIVGGHGEMKKLNPETGEIAATMEVPDSIASPPIIAGERMYLSSEDATIYVMY